MELIKDGKRIDGRAPDELRPIKIEAGPLYRADGSCYLEWGGNKIMAAVYGPKEAIPRHIQDSTKAVINARYNMASFSVEDRKRPGPDRRSQEISKITAEALENVILTEMFPRAVIDVNIEVLDADAGTRCAGITAAAVALADAGIPMRDIPVACAAGKVDGVVVLDLLGDEDKKGDADLPVAIAPRSEEILLLQMDGHMTVEEFDEALELALKGCREISKLQKEALLKKYKTFEEE
ncbi:MAG: exosome complex exonuclease Rrp41 [Thermoplasmata archaeon]|nr:MAG: exosome complex exonuclease Rrp41 [Thermoplasmata archaeon]HDH81602.1 exosome complex exonuclease Rrp41 [Thermoplasmatales archaeon]MCD6147016.1 exosome complex exonuclease Rrp41 [Thermoplasmata archaeon]RLF45509.1 MAG: exosome complex exonuclease Rrp41 [Thermoplasmata archaeon]RLF48094.1 MAG: exosome complex exonuclease Rrp41 [Thermoplasmata archaeon]